jgi:hypothetical protein
VAPGLGGGLVDMKRAVRGVMVEDEYSVRGRDFRRLRGRVRVHGAIVTVETVEMLGTDDRWQGSGAWWPVSGENGAAAND